MATHLLLGLADAEGHYTVNAGGSVLEDYVVDLPDEVVEFKHIQVNVENCSSVSFQSAGVLKTIQHLTLRSYTGSVVFNGGAVVGSLTVEANDVTFNCADQLIKTVVVKDPNQEDYRVMREQLQGVCLTPGSGSYFAEGSKYLL